MFDLREGEPWQCALRGVELGTGTLVYFHKHALTKIFLRDGTKVISLFFTLEIVLIFRSRASIGTNKYMHFCCSVVLLYPWWAHCRQRGELRHNLMHTTLESWPTSYGYQYVFLIQV